jgi:hypothetical protein
MANRKFRAPDLTFVLVFLSQFSVLGLMMRLDPDPHHDGILYGAAVSVSNNGFPNRDTFAQYGPLIPELQGLWLRIFGPSLFNIRLQALFVMVIASVCIWHVAKFYVSRRLAYLISSSWALTIPSVLPWPTAYTTLISVLSLLLMLDLKTNSLHSNRFRIFSASSLIAIGTFGRIHLFAIFFLVLVYIVFASDQRSKVKYWVAGFVFTSFTILPFLQLNDALGEFFTQCISWPLLHYGSPDFNKSYIIGLFWYPVIAISLLTLVLITWWLKSRYFPKLLIFALPLFIFITLFFISRIERTGYLSLRNPRVMLIDYSKNMMNSLDYAAAFLMILSTFFLLLKVKQVKSYVAISILYSTGILAQLYPLYDVNHLWLIAPLLIISSLVTFGNSEMFIKYIKPNISSVLLGLLVALALQIWATTSIPRVSFDSPSLRGMLAPAAFAKQLDSTMLKLEIYAKPGSTAFNCVNGIYSGSGGKYLASSRQFVSWGPDAELAITGDRVFLCAVTDMTIDEFLSDGYTVIFKDPLTLFGESQPRGYWNILLSKVS